MARRKAPERREPVFEAKPAELRMKAEDRVGSRKGRRGGVLRRLSYWTLVLGIWVMMAGGAVLALVAATLPPIQELAIPKRPPSIEIIGLDGKAFATRGEWH